MRSYEKSCASSGILGIAQTCCDIVTTASTNEARSVRRQEGGPLPVAATSFLPSPILPTPAGDSHKIGPGAGVLPLDCVQCTGILSQIRTKLRDWAVGQTGGSCYSWAALSSNDSKTLYVDCMRGNLSGVRPL